MINKNKLFNLNGQVVFSYLSSILKQDVYEDIEELRKMCADNSVLFNIVLSAQKQVGYEQGLSENTLTIEQNINTINGTFTGVKIDVI